MSRAMNGLPEGVRPQDLPTIAELPRLRVRYGKSDRLAYLGHLEVLNTIERSIRRSRVPFSIGNGFARRIRIQYSQALPLGASSTAEYFDLRLVERLEPEEALAALAAATPPGLAPVEAAYVAGDLPALEAWLDHAEWQVTAVAEGWDAADLAASIEAIKARGTLTYLRGAKEKKVDVGSSLVEFEACGCPEGVSLRMVTANSGGGALRPQVLLDAASKEAGMLAASTYRVCRTDQRHA